MKPDHRDIEQIELNFPDEVREFFLKRKCPSCGSAVFVSKDVDRKTLKISWTVGCNGPDRCHVTRPVSDYGVAMKQFKMISTLLK